MLYILLILDYCMAIVHRAGGLFKNTLSLSPSVSKMQTGRFSLKIDNFRKPIRPKTNADIKLIITTTYPDSCLTKVIIS